MDLALEKWLANALRVVEVCLNMGTDSCTTTVKSTKHTAGRMSTLKNQSH